MGKVICIYPYVPLTPSANIFERGNKRIKRNPKMIRGHFPEHFGWGGLIYRSNSLHTVKIVKKTSLKYSSIVWKIQNRINKFMDSRGEKW
jgi:3-hydroxymyristoyl/3-hydroxydecanoyl-(acyl carrier protein) dehydratase